MIPFWFHVDEFLANIPKNTLGRFTGLLIRAFHNTNLCFLTVPVESVFCIIFQQMHKYVRCMNTRCMKISYAHKQMHIKFKPPSFIKWKLMFSLIKLEPIFNREFCKDNFPLMVVSIKLVSKIPFWTYIVSYKMMFNFNMFAIECKMGLLVKHIVEVLSQKIEILLSFIF